MLHINTHERELILYKILPDNGYDESGLEGIEQGLNDALDNRRMRKYSNAYKHGYEKGLEYLMNNKKWDTEYTINHVRSFI